MKIIRYGMAITAGICLTANAVLLQALPSQLPIQRLSPRIQIEPIAPVDNQATLQLVSPYQKRMTIMSQEDIVKAPIVVDIQEGHLLAGPNTLVSVSGFKAKAGSAPETYMIVQLGEPLVDPLSHEKLGFTGIIKGTVTHQSGESPALFRVENAYSEIEAGDKLLPVNELSGKELTLKPLNTPFQSHIMAVFGGVTEIAAGHVVVIHGGKANLAPGDVVAAYRSSLGQAPIGKLMVFKVFEQASLALVLQTQVGLALNEDIGNF